MLDRTQLRQNKDSLEIPLLLEQLPTPQEFKDAVRARQYKRMLEYLYRYGIR